MINPRFLFFALSSLLLGSPVLHGQIVETRGVGEVFYARGFGLSTADEQRALRLAQTDALNRYLAGLSAAKRSEYARFMALLESEPQRFVKIGRVLDETRDTTQRRYTVTIRAEINVAALEDLVASGSAVRAADESEKSGLIFVFVSRKAAGVRQFDDRRTARTEQTSSVETSESAAFNENHASSLRETTSVVVATTGGSTEIKSDQIQYRVSSSDDLNTTITRVFADAGYLASEAEALEPEHTGGKLEVQAFMEDFSRGNDISATTRRNALQGLQKAARAEIYKDQRLRFLLVGAMDVDRNLRDPASGLLKVYVNVNAKIYDASRPLPVMVASIGPVQFSGLGPTESVAERNALLQAGEAAATELVSQMRAKNLR